MAGEANQGNGSAQEAGTGNQGQSQEDGQQKTGDQAQEAGAGGGQGTGQESGSQTDISKMSEADLRAYAAKVQKDAEEARREAAGFRKRATAAEGKVTEAERAAMTEAERVQADLAAEREKATALEQRVLDLTVGTSAREALTAAGAINAATALKVMGTDDIKVKDGKVDEASVAKAITALRATDPYLFKRTANADAGAGGGGAPESGASVNDFIRGRTGR